MNIWYLSAHDQPKGQSSRTYDLSIELVKRGHQVTIFTNSYCHWTHKELLDPSEQWRIEEIDGIRVVWLRTIHYTGNGLMRGANMFSNARRCLQVSKTLSDKPDVVIGPSVPLGTGWAAARIAKRKGAAFIFEVRDVWPIILVYDGGLSKYSPIYFAFRYLEKYLYSKAHRISTAVGFIFDHVAESGSDPKKVVWVPNGVNFDRYIGYGTYGGGGSPIVVMYAGGFGKAHDVITIVRAAAILQKSGNDNFRFVLIGDGVKRPECQKEASINKLANIEFRDPVPKTEIPRLQMEADIFIACVTDSASYSFGLNLNKIYDYYASGRPVIFSGNAPNDPVKDSGSGYSIPPENPEKMVEALLKYSELSPEERVVLGERGRQYVKNNFDIKVLAARFEAMLIEAVKDSRN